MKITDSVKLTMYMRDNEKNATSLMSLAPARAVLHSKHLKVLDSIIPKDQKHIRNISIIKYLFQNMSYHMINLYIFRYLIKR
jgi:hypothetical protein